MRVNFQRRPLTNEFKLLVECCRWNFAGNDRQAVQQLTDRVEWREISKLARRHRVQTLVWKCLSEIGAPHLPVLAEEASGVVQHNLRSAQLCRLLRTEFEGSGIPLIFLKGLTLSQLAYGDPFVKMGWDVDVLIPPEAVAESARLLHRLDFRLTIPDADPKTAVEWHRRRKESVWRSPDGLFVELHTRLADNPRMIPAIGMNSETQQVAIAPGFSLPTLATRELFAYLCVHGASSAWFRLKWITDLAALIHRRSFAEIGNLCRDARDSGAGRAVDQAMLLMADLYGLGPDPTTGDQISRWLASVAWDQILREAEPTATRLGTLPIHYSQLFLQPGPGFKMGELVRQISDWATKPR